MFRRSWQRILWLPVFAWITFSAFAQQTIHVPADQPTIQAGINAAQNGDTVLVAPGTYVENIDFKGKAITVTSGATSFTDAAITVLQPAQKGALVTFQTGETPASVLNGFTIEKGFAVNFTDPAGDGIDILNASPTITNNVITQNTGCGIFALNPQSLTIQKNSITNNLAEVSSGSTGYPHCGQSRDDFDNNGGDGIYIRGGGSAQVLGNTLENNSYTNINLNAVPTALVENNWSANSGGGAFVSTSSPPNTVSVVQNIFFTSSVDPGGGGWGFATLDSTTFFGDYVAVNNTFYNSGLGFENSPSQAKVANNIDSFDPTLYVSGNYVGTTDLFVCYQINLGTFDYSHIVANNNDFDTEDISYVSTSCPLATGNINANPQFLNTNPSSFDFHTERTSPVVAAGDITAPMIPATDFAGKNRTVCGTIDMGAYEVHPQPPIAITSTPNPSVGGSSVTFTAHLTGNCNVPTGTITFMDGANVLGTGLLDTNASASFSTAALTVGTHAITVTYPGDFNFDPNTSAPYTQVVTGYPTMTSLSVSPNPATAFTPITFSSTVTSSFGTPTGTVAFTANGQLLATAALNANGVASTTISTLGAGTYNVVATYSADVHFAASASGTVVEVVNGADSITTLTGAPNPADLLQTVTFNVGVRAAQGTAVPTGTVALTDGSTPLTTVTLNASGNGSFSTSTLALGSHTITATYGSSGNFGTSSAQVIEVITTIQSGVALTASPNPAAVGQTVTLSATISAANGTPTSGTVVFSDQFGTVGSAPVVAGEASFSTSSLAAGTHNIIASYSGGGGYGEATSPVFNEVIQSFDFSISLNPSSLSLSAGKAGVVQVVLTGVGNVPGNVALTAGAAPAYGSVSLNPATVQFAGGGTGSSALSIETVQLPAQASLDGRSNLTGRSPLLFAAFLSLPVFLIGRRKRAPATMPRLLCSLLAVVVIAALTGCTESYIVLNKVAPGTYSIPVTGIDQVSRITHTATLRLTVTP